ncbi:MAG: hypothetical protein H0U74_01630 [Bradymonadaceae bacterium]|nr:hypothetical protein [Lujinxingiaceae bacterium]
MSYTLINLLMQALLTMHLIFPGLSGLLGAELADNRSQYMATMSERGDLVGELRSLEQRYQKFVTDIEKLKRSGQDGLKTRRDLENLLRQSRQISDELDELQQRIRKVDGRLDGQRTRLVGELDSELRRLERSLAKATPQERSQAVAQLNALRAERQQYTAPMPALPDHGRLRQALAMADEFGQAHPAEMLAAADELEDSEDQVRRRLAAVEVRIGELQAARRLSRRAQSFRREESFFEEGDRSRLIARYQRDTRVVVNEHDGQSKAGQNNASSDFDGDTPYAPSPPLSEGVAEAERGNDDSDMVVGAPEPGQYFEPEVGPTATPSYEDRRERVVFESSVDPSRSVEVAGFGEAGLDRSLQDLEQERRRLEKQASELRSRANTLRQNAREALK